MFSTLYKKRKNDKKTENPGENDIISLMWMLIRVISTVKTRRRRKSEKYILVLILIYGKANKITTISESVITTRFRAC